MSGIPGCADLFFFRVFMEGVAESEMMINMRLLGRQKNAWMVFMRFQHDRMWSVSADIVTTVEQILRVALNSWRSAWGCGDIQTCEGQSYEEEDGE